MMEQSDLDLLQMVPSYHVQSVVKTRLGASFKGPSTESSSSASSSSSLTTIAEALFEPASVQKAMQHLSELEHLILRELVSCGGRANSRDLALYFTSSGLLASARKPEQAGAYVGFDEPVEPMAGGTSGPLQYPAAHPHGIFEQSVRHLLVLGLAFWGRQTNFAGRDYSSGIHDGVLIVPLAVRTVVRQEMQLVAPQPAALSPISEEVNEQVHFFQRTLYLYWSMVASMREGLSVVSSGLLARSSLRHVAEQLGSRLHAEQARVENDVPLLVFVRLLLMKLGLLQERSGVVYAASAEEFFALSPLERARRCYRLYVETAFWNELLYLTDINVRPGPQPLDPAHEEVIKSRHITIDRVMQETPDVWHSFSTLIARTKLYAPYLLFPRQYGSRAERYSNGSNPYGWDFRLRRGWLTHREGWHMVEGGFIRAVVMGPLHWLGLVDLDHEENPGAFRLSANAASVLSNDSVEESKTAWGRLIVQPNFELVALAPVSEHLLVQLDRFADRVSLEHIAQYRVTKASVTRAIQKGLHAEQLQEMLEQAAGGEIPQNVHYSLGEWERQARRIEIWQDATLLEVDEEELLDKLFADEQTRALFGRRLGPRLVEIAPWQKEAVQQLLWQRNYLPALSTAPNQETGETGRGSSHETQWRLHVDGSLQPLYAVLDLYLVAEAEQFSQRDETTGWLCITPASLQQALKRDDVSLTSILRFLQHYCEGGIPGPLLIRLKLWGSGYDREEIAVESAPLLRLPAQVLQDLYNDPEIRPLLSSEVEQQSSLVRVEADQLERILALLRERGFDIS